MRQQLTGVQMLIFSAVAFYYVRLSTNLLLLSSLCVILIRLVRGCSLQGYYGWQLQRATQWQEIITDIIHSAVVTRENYTGILPKKRDLMGK